MNVTTNTRCAAFGIAVSLVSVLATTTAVADDEWTGTVGAQSVYGAYSDAVLRESTYSIGVILKSDFLEQGGYTVGLNRINVAAKGGAPNIRQNALFVSGRYYFTPDQWLGRLGARLDLHAVDNDDSTGDTDEVRVLAPQLSFQSFDGRRYYELGYAHSRYQNGLLVRQWTPAVGFGYNKNADWMLMRGWYIDPSNPARAQGRDSTVALELKWVHWLDPNGAGIDNLKFSVIGGERIYAVDGDAGSVANLADVSRGGASLGAEWKIGRDVALHALVGYDRFSNADLVPVDNYALNYAYLWLSSRW